MQGKRSIREAAGFCALAVALLVFLFRDAVLRGYVLGQADVLFDFLPWQLHRPPGWRIHNRLLGDISAIFYPFLQHARETVLSGRFPLWSSAVGSGQPFFAAFQTAVLSPFTWLDYLLPFPAAFTVDVAARLLVGGVGMYAFLRALPLCRGAAWFGGVAFLLNPFSIVWLEHPLSAVAAWLPWLLLSIDVCVTRADRRSVAMLALVTTMMLLAGHPETAFKALLLGGSYAVYRGVVSGTAPRAIALVASAMILAATLSAIQLVPFFEYAWQSRVLAVRSAAGHPMFTSPAASFVTAFVPDFYGTPLRNRFVLDGTNYCEQQLYAGVSAWLFGAMALMHRRHRGRAVFFLAAGAVAVLIMYGTPVARIATFLIPPLRVAALSRFGLIAISGLTIAGAIGVDAMFGGHETVKVDGSDPPRRFTQMAVVGTIAAAVIAAIIFAFLSAQRGRLVDGHQWLQTVRSTTWALELLGGAVALLFIAPRLRHPAAVALPIAWLAFDLLSFAGGFHALMPREFVFPPIPELSIVTADKGLFRVAGWVDTLLPNTAMVYGLQDFRAYDGVGIRDYDDLLSVGFRFTGNTHQLANMATPHLLDLLNIKYVLTPSDVDLPHDRFQLLQDGPMRVYLNQRVLPRAFLVDASVVIDGTDALRAIRDRGVDLTRLAVVDHPIDPRPEPARPGGGVGTATVQRYGDDDVSVMTRAEGRRLLVLSDVYYPGWEATVDGATVPIYRVDYAFRGISVPAGQHVVGFRYRPASLRYGAVTSVVGVVVVGWLLRRRRTQTEARRRAEPPSGPEFEV